MLPNDWELMLVDMSQRSGGLAGYSGVAEGDRYITKPSLMPDATDRIAGKAIAEWLFRPVEQAYVMQVPQRSSFVASGGRGGGEPFAEKAASALPGKGWRILSSSAEAGLSCRLVLHVRRRVRKSLMAERPGRGKVVIVELSQVVCRQMGGRDPDVEGEVLL